MLVKFYFQKLNGQNSYIEFCFYIFKRSVYCEVYTLWSIGINLNAAKKCCNIWILKLKRNDIWPFQVLILNIYAPNSGTIIYLFNNKYWVFKIWVLLKVIDLKNLPTQINALFLNEFLQTNRKWYNLSSYTN